MIIQNSINTLVVALQSLWYKVVGFVPSLILGLAAILLGVLVATALEQFVERIIYYLKVDTLLRRLGIESYLERANVRLNTGHFLGQIVYWFFILVFLLAASDILGFIALSTFLQDVLNYIPNVIVAMLILLAALVAANFVRGLVRSSIMGARLHSGKTLGAIAWWGIAVFGFLTALTQLGVAVQIINTLITGLVAMLALAGGLAFGLGGKEHASEWLTKMREELNHRK